MSDSSISNASYSAELISKGGKLAAVAQIRRKHEICAPTCYYWKSTYAGAAVPELKRLRALEAGNAKLAFRSRSVGFAVSPATFTVPVAAIDDIPAFGGSANSPEFDAYAWYSENDSPCGFVFAKLGL